MSVPALELGQYESIDDSDAPGLFDVNQVLSEALGLNDGQVVRGISAYNVRIIKQQGKFVALGRGALVVDFQLQTSGGDALPTKRLEIDDTNRPIPEQLISEFGALALQQPTFERIELG